MAFGIDWDNERDFELRQMEQAALQEFQEEVVEGWK